MTQTYDPSEAATRIQATESFEDLQLLCELLQEEKFTYTLIELWAFKWLIEQQTYKLRNIDATELRAFFKGILGIDI